MKRASGTHRFNGIYAVGLVLTFFLLGCNAGGGGSGRSRSRRAAINNNSPGSVNVGFGRILEANPIVLSGNPNLSAPINAGNFLSSAQTFITNNATLVESCSSPDGLNTVTSCYSVLEKPTSLPINSIDGKWAFNPSSSAFYQVNTFGHIRRGIERYLSALDNANNIATGLGVGFLGSLPANLYTSRAFWLDDKELQVFSQCQEFQNAFYDPATFQLCFGDDLANTGILFVQDPSVIYHELGHALVSNMMNIRNVASLPLTISTRVDLGEGGYDEAGALNEGIADYFSFMITGRAFFGEWAAGRFFNQGRPLSEGDPIYDFGISTEDDERLSYPRYINFDPNFPTNNVEDIHYTGQIASHYMKAVTEDFQSFCGDTVTDAQNKVFYLLVQTLAELGDLTSQGSDNAANPHNVNLVPTNGASQDWARVANAINYRRFFQTFGKYMVQSFVGANCTTGLLTQDLIEKRLDDYGLLLFKSFNNNGNGFLDGAATQPGHDGVLLTVDPANRLDSVLMSKDRLIFDPGNNRPKAFIIDDRQQMFNIVQALKLQGLGFDFSTQIPSDLGFNNGNGSLSRGEVVGVALNLFNQGNIDMGEVQVLANDWDHAKTDNGELKLCPVFEDSFPSTAENAADVSADDPNTAGDCNHITKTNGGEAAETLAPVCFVQNVDANQTSWVSQERFRELRALPTTDCLAGSTSTNDCYLRVVKGGEMATFSKINQGATYSDSLNLETNGSVTFNANNLLIFEVSKFIPPGTTFDCRFRARFANCDDCYHDPTTLNDDYLDFEYAGARPFKLFHLQFTIIN